MAVAGLGRTISALDPGPDCTRTYWHCWCGLARKLDLTDQQGTQQKQHQGR